MWQPPPLAGHRPAFVEIADLIGEAIGAGRIAPREKLPTVRTLAGKLGIATATALRGYAEARRRGLIEGNVGSGTFALAPAEENAQRREQFAARGFAAPGVYDLRSNVVPGPPEWTEPAGRAALLPSPRRQREMLASAYAIGTSMESGALREAGSRWASWCGVEAAPREILVAAGGQHGIAAALAALRLGGARLAVPALTNSGVLEAARMTGVEIVPIRMDEDGVVPSHLDRVCRSGARIALYCAPAGGNPIPTPMSAERRSAIARISELHGCWIVEDDAPGPLVDRDAPTLAGLLPHRTLWIGSVAQSLGFGFRLAFVRVPGPLEAVMQEALRSLAWAGTTPAGLLAAQAIADGTAEMVLAARRSAIAERHRLARSILDRGHVVAAPGIPYFWFEVPIGWSAAGLHDALLRAGVAVAPAGQFAADPRKTWRGVRISAGSLLDLDQYRDALNRIARTCAHPGRWRQAGRDAARSGRPGAWPADSFDRAAAPE
jgi:DNA-binding transcriptional MocR family regulator